MPKHGGPGIRSDKIPIETAAARGEECTCGSWKGEKHTFQNALKQHQSMDIDSEVTYSAFPACVITTFTVPIK